MPRQRKVLLLGSSGSIGSSALKVSRAIPERMEIVGLAVQRNVEVLVKQVAATKVRQVCVSDAESARRARSLLPKRVRVFQGAAGLVELVKASDADLVLV